ncbi:MAG: hypothetical protein GYB42_09515 [Alphaproteobacteria bacterium]|nr:hypothetical protein [Alphaproteobacteria bacterium]
MKLALPLIALGLLASCITSEKFDLDRAYARCETIKTVTVRDRCIADAVAESERRRQIEAQRDVQREADAEARELGRVIAGAEQD